MKYRLNCLTKVLNELRSCSIEITGEKGIREQRDTASRRRREQAACFHINKVLDYNRPFEKNAILDFAYLIRLLNGHVIEAVALEGDVSDYDRELSEKNLCVSIDQMLSRIQSYKEYIGLDSFKAYTGIDD